MAPRLLPFQRDPIRPEPPAPVTITVDGAPATGALGQSLAGVILASGTLAFRRTSVHGAPRGVFCGIGVCYDCLVEVNGQRDVRACQRRASDGDAVVTQYDELPGESGLDKLDQRGRLDGAGPDGVGQRGLDPSTSSGRRRLDQRVLDQRRGDERDDSAVRDD